MSVTDLDLRHRLPPDLRAKLASNAAIDGRSLTDEIILRLEQSVYKPQSFDRTNRRLLEILLQDRTRKAERPKHDNSAEAFSPIND